MNRLALSVAIGVAVWATPPLAATAQVSSTPAPALASDDLNADGVKLRGDGSVDDNSDAGEDRSGRSSDEERGGHGGDNGRGNDRDGGRDHERGRDRERDRDHGGHGHG